MPIRLQKIDEHTRPDHSYLDENDECYYLLEYTPREGFAFSSANDIILNLKKSVDRRGRAEYRYKEWAIQRSSALLREALSAQWIASATLVPVPCSKQKNHPLYDDRMLQVLQRTTDGLPCDVQELVIQNDNLDSFHDGYRLRPYQLKAYYELDPDLRVREVPREVAIFDDLLTTGCHFKAMQSIIHDHWPTVLVSGIFIARRYIPHGEDGE